jgi:hypothetical protein
VMDRQHGHRRGNHRDFWQPNLYRILLYLWTGMLLR